jgi:Alpha/beta hydrolase domain
MTNSFRFVVAAVLLVAGALRADAEIVRVDVTRRADVGASGYEKIVGIAHFAVDPNDARNRVVVNLDKAPRNAAGKVEFSADLFILRPRDAARSNGVALIEVSNRGRKGLLTGFSRAPGTLDPSTDADLGDGFLTRQGYTLVWVGWQFDVRRQDGLVGIQVPDAAGVSGIVRAEFTPNERAEQTVADLAGYAAGDPNASDTTLTVRDGPFGKREPIARGRWSLRGSTVALTGGFEPGRTYEVAYRAANLPVEGLGLAAFRDTATWIKHQPDALATARHAIAWGSSQSGRFLRTFLYYGFNADERGRQVLDGVMAHIAGAARLSINERGATPNALSMFTATGFPFADAAQRDPISGRTEGLLDNDRARGHQPKVFYTNSAVEYWGGGRSAALVHTTADGSADVTPPDNVRVYFLTGTQHSPGRFPPRATAGQQADNPVEYWWTLRALLTSMDRWVRQGTAPPASQYPRIADGTLVRADRIAFPALKGVASPRTIPAARQGTHVLPLLVPQVDADGNERAGIRSPEIAVPLATYTGWNFRSPATGGPAYLVNLMGSSLPFAPTSAERAKTGDPRRSVDERYRSKDAYVAAYRQHAESLVKGGYLLADDVAQVMRRAEEQWTHSQATGARRQSSAQAR